MKLELAGKKIKIRKHKLSDANDIYKNIKDKEITKWTCSIPYPYPRNEAVRFIRRAHHGIKNRKSYDFAITLLDTGKIVGGISFRKIDWENKNAEIGYWIGKKYWGRGLATEAVKLALKFSFENLKLHRIWAYVFEENIFSIKILKKCKFKLEGKTIKSSFRYARWHNDFMYAILKSDFVKHYR